MAKVKKTDEDIMERLFGNRTPKSVPLDLTGVAERIAGVSSVPKKSLVPEKILAIKPNRRCMNILAKHWDKLRELALIKFTEANSYRGYSAEDVLIETFEYIVRDKKVKGATEKEIIKLFIYRYQNLMWVTKMDAILERQIFGGGKTDPVTFASDDENTK